MFVTRAPGNVVSKFEKVRLITGPCSDNIDYAFVRINGTHVCLPHVFEKEKKEESGRTKDRFPVDIKCRVSFL